MRTQRIMLSKLGYIRENFSPSKLYLCDIIERTEVALQTKCSACCDT
jgi:hypothetical protein